MLPLWSAVSRGVRGQTELREEEKGVEWVVAALLERSLLEGELGSLAYLKKQIQLFLPLHAAIHSSTAVWPVSSDGPHATPHLTY